VLSGLLSEVWDAEASLFTRASVNGFGRSSVELRALADSDLFCPKIDEKSWLKEDEFKMDEADAFPNPEVRPRPERAEAFPEVLPEWNGLSAALLLFP